jgi:hypothetical protein
MDLHRGSFGRGTRPHKDSDRSDASAKRAAEEIRAARGEVSRSCGFDDTGLNRSGYEPYGDGRQHDTGRGESNPNRGQDPPVTNSSTCRQRFTDRCCGKSDSRRDGKRRPHRDPACRCFSVCFTEGEGCANHPAEEQANATATTSGRNAWPANRHFAGCARGQRRSLSARNQSDCETASVTLGAFSPDPDAASSRSQNPALIAEHAGTDA